MLEPSEAETLATSVHRELERDRDRLVHFASELIRVPSENPPGRAYDRCAAVIAEHLDELGFEPETLDPTGAGPCVVASLGGGGRALYFSGHYDVVLAQDAAQFEPAVAGGELRGRGAADMKGGIAAMALAMRALARSGFEPDGRVVWVAVPDEETSGPNGTVALARAGFVERDAIGMLTMEPTGGAVWNANRGVLSLRVTVRGEPAHVGVHYQGVNAFRDMLTVAGMFSALETLVARRRTQYAISPEAARGSVLLLGGELDGGHSFNVVPERVSFTVDRRPNPEEDFDAEREALLQVVADARARGIRCDAELFQEGRPGASNPAGDAGRALAASIDAVTGEAARFELCPGVLETRHYAALGIPAFAYGPGELAVSHGPQERVSIDALLRCAEVYALTAARLLS